MKSETINTEKKKTKKRSRQTEIDGEEIKTPYFQDDLEESTKEEIQHLFEAQKGAIHPVKKKSKKLAQQDTVNEQTSPKQAASDYLHLWLNDRDNWKFRKVRQTWLLQNMYDKTLVDKETFKILLEYLDGLQGQSRKNTIEHAQSILESDEKDKRKIKRATKILRLLA